MGRVCEPNATIESAALIANAQSFEPWACDRLRQNNKQVVSATQQYKKRKETLCVGPRALLAYYNHQREVTHLLMLENKLKTSSRVPMPLNNARFK